MNLEHWTASTIAKADAMLQVEQWQVGERSDSAGAKRRCLRLWLAFYFGERQVRGAFELVPGKRTTFHRTDQCLDQNE